MNEKLTPKQIKNWRGYLATMIGPYAMKMPEEKIIKIRGNMQKYIDKMDKKGSE